MCVNEGYYKETMFYSAHINHCRTLNTQWIKTGSEFKTCMRENRFFFSLQLWTWTLPLPSSPSSSSPSLPLLSFILTATCSAPLCDNSNKNKTSLLDWKCHRSCQEELSVWEVKTKHIICFMVTQSSSHRQLKCVCVCVYTVRAAGNWDHHTHITQRSAEETVNRVRKRSSGTAENTLQARSFICLCICKIRESIWTDWWVAEKECVVSSYCFLNI